MFDILLIPRINVWWTWTAGQVLEVVLAKPQTEKKPEGGFPYGAGVPPNHLPHAGYGGFAGAPYGAVGAGFGVAASFQQVFDSLCKSFLFWWSSFIINKMLSKICICKQPMIYGRGPMPAGMHMVPMVLPDGRIGYVL